MGQLSQSHMPVKSYSPGNGILCGRTGMSSCRLGVEKFHKYLFGKEFILETDHQPLTYLNTAKVANSRLMRWALLLQPYRMTIRAIRGVDNVGADYLSRT